VGYASRFYVSMGIGGSKCKYVSIYGKYVSKWVDGYYPSKDGSMEVDGLKWATVFGYGNYGLL
jgi:hypothetical protein